MFWKVLVVVLAFAAPAAFPLAQHGYAPLNELAVALVLPAAGLLALTWLGLRLGGRRELSSRIRAGAWIGVVATLALETVRYPGFELGLMPGNLPQLMGVLLLDRFALGPSALSDLAGFAYHFWIGANFGIVYAVVAGGRSRWWAVPYGAGIGAGFLASPVVRSLGGGFLGLEFGWAFIATVMSAHLAFGTVFALLWRVPAPRPSRSQPSAGREAVLARY